MKLFTGMEYLKIAVANGYGLDKLSWEERIEWTDINWSNIYSFLPKADEPCLMLGAIQALEKAKKRIPIGYPVSLDATSSGPQILSCLTRCEKSAKLCNVLSTGKREDLYTNIYKAYLAKKGQGKQKIERIHIKQAIMTSFYGSQATPKKIFGEGAGYDLFEKVMEEEAPGAWKLNKLFLDIWNPEQEEYTWILPDNFHVHCPVETKVTESFLFKDGYYNCVQTIIAPQKKGRALGANITHSLDAFILREILRRSNYDKNHLDFISIMKPTMKIKENAKTEMLRQLLKLGKDSGFYSARIIDYIEEYNISLVPKDVLNELLESFSDVPFETITIHDCFRVLPNYGNQVRRLYTTMLAFLWRSNMLEFILNQIRKDKHFSFPNSFQEKWKDVLESEYALS